MTARYIVHVSIIGALYASLTVALSPISYGPLQIRVSEALTVLPYITPSAILGLFIGCFIANWLGGLGPWDIFLGSFLTLIAAIMTYLTSKTSRPWLAPLPPILINAFGVSAYLQLLFEPPRMPFLGGIPPYLLFVITVGMGEIIACYGLGYPLLRLLLKHKGVFREPAG